MQDESAPHPEPDQRNVWIFTVVTIYFLGALAWIYLSDSLLEYLLRDNELIFRISIYKGMFFVGSTTLLLYLLLIHQKRQLQKAERTQKQQYERIKALSLLSAIANTSEDAIFAKDLEGRYTLINPAGARLAGRTPEQLLGCCDHDFFPREHADENQRTDRQVLEQRCLLSRENSFDAEGGPFTFLTVKGPLVDENGKVVGIFGISRNISERKQAEKTLRESEARFRALFDNAAVAISIIDYDSGTVTEANKKALSQPGFAALLNQPSDSDRTASPPGRAEALSMLEKVRKSGAQHFEWRNQNAYGHVYWEDVLLQKISLNASEKILAITTDITDQKATQEELCRQTQELEEKNRELLRFNSAMIGRELAMIDLKLQINTLSQQLGKPQPFQINNVAELAAKTSEPAP